MACFSWLPHLYAWLKDASENMGAQHPCCRLVLAGKMPLGSQKGWLQQVTY